MFSLYADFMCLEALSLCAKQQPGRVKDMKLRRCIPIASIWFTAFFMSSITSQNHEDAIARFLTNDSEIYDYWPTFSPDGKTILFSRSSNKRLTWELFTISLSGGEAKKFTEKQLPVSSTRANWSTKDNVIAFSGTTLTGKATVWLIDTDGSNPRQLVTEELLDQVYYPSWYPGGSSLAVMDANELSIKRIEFNDNIVTTLTSNSQVFTGMPSVSPDGKWIAFAGQENKGLEYNQAKNSIWLITDEGDVRTLESNPAQGRTPSWSPDGQWLAFESDRGNADGLYAIFIIHRDGTRLQRISSYEISANHPVWSPNGRQLVFSAHHTKNSDASGIAVVDVSVE